MDISKRTRQLCKKYNICPSRSKGQNFLIRESVYKRIVKAADLHKNDVVLEVGPGLGFLTEMLARGVKKVVAVELDDRLAETLRAKLQEKSIENVEVVNMDILRFKIKDLRFKISDYKVVANLPYNITSRFLRTFLEEVKVKPIMLVLMVQKEVAERIVAGPGEMSLLAVSVQFYADAQIIEVVPKEAFWPKPKVDSAIITLTPHPPLPLSRRGGIAGEGELDEKRFFKLVKVGFRAKRKQLKNNLAKGFSVKGEIIADILREVGFNGKVRAQELSVDDWGRLLVVLEGRNMV